MLLLVFQFVDIRALRDTLLRIPLSSFVFVVCGYLAGQLISSYKWWRIAVMGGVDVPYKTALKAYFIGMYANCFGLGLVGGDVARGILIADGKPVKTAAMASVVADRAHGLAVLLLIGVIFSFAVEGHVIENSLRYLLALLALALLIGWFFGSTVIPKLVPKDHPWFKPLLSAAQAFPRTPGKLWGITALSVVFHLSQIGLHAVMAKGLGIKLSFTDLLVSIPFVNIVSSLPISWNGLGVRENTYMYFLRDYITSEQALAFGTLWLAGMTISSAIGGIVAFVTGDFSVLRPVSKQLANQDNKVGESLG